VEGKLESIYELNLAEFRERVRATVSDQSVEDAFPTDEEAGEIPSGWSVE